MSHILCCEDENVWKGIIERNIKETFSDYTFILVPSVREGLTELTSVDFKTLRSVSIDSVTEALRQGNADFSTLKLVITDGHLIDPYAGAHDVVLNGWDLAQILRNVDYKRSIVYIGTGEIPSGRGGLFNKTISKLDDNFLLSLIDYCHTQLE